MGTSSSYVNGLQLKRLHGRPILWGVLALVIAVVLTSGAQQVWARTHLAPTTDVASQISPLHPTFVLLDEQGVPVLTSGAPVSTMRTCGFCHDTAFIEEHSFHADLGLADFRDPNVTLAQPWDSSRGLFGKWDPLVYRLLSPADAERLDLSTAEWLMLNGGRVAGGGPATTARDGTPLTALTATAENPETSLLDPATGEATAWDWQTSGVMEMDCFLCHMAEPNNAARIEAIRNGDFGWANTATLVGTGIVEQSTEGYLWRSDAFDTDGKLLQALVQIQDPTNENCAQCHGAVHTDSSTPLVIDACDLDDPQTATTGQVIAGQRINESGLNLADKDSLARSWDIHAERGLKCTDCHYALNNPVHAQDAADSRPAHLVYDPRRLEIGEYLERPNHNFARGESAQYTVDPDLKGSMRRCESCHDAEATHDDWLPYTTRHLEVLACESCHIPELNAPAISSYDWTVLTTEGDAVTDCRGITGDDTVNNLVTGYQPVLMQRTNVDGDTLLAPYNLISSWYWVYDDANGDSYPVRLADLQAAYLDGDSYVPAILDAFDTNGDGSLGENELVIDSDAKEQLVVDRLTALGLANPRIEGQVQPYSINHNVARSEWATNACQDCHRSDSVIAQPLALASNLPGGVVPTFVGDTNVASSGTLNVVDGALFYAPQPERDGIYIFGRDRVAWVDWFGVIAFLGTLLGVGAHGTLRFISSLRHPHHAPQLERVYMYQAYERFWHWLQTVTIILLLFTGLVIHRPDLLGIFAFRYMVAVHNVLAAVLVINAGLSLFWHLVGGEIRQYIPRPAGFFDQAIEQAKYYLYGIFRDAPHPFEKTRERHLNPLQQVTYFGILNVLLPLQILTGALMWGVQQWPQYAQALGGLPFLAPFHSLVAWLFATFIVGHVYLTTTGHEPLAGIKSMITGWDEVEVHEAI
ncbi:MAG TPA: cytochrome b/b6 domain-containing protein [Caldilineaceae bacterium]|nr:cytochrome b/b6 domain-containing protein [Caldilineaceae bacterium]